jgi:hypothetical protein
LAFQGVEDGFNPLADSAEFPEPGLPVFLVRSDQFGSEFAAWIEGHYNRRRWHASLGQISPVSFELRYSHQTVELLQAS